MRKIIFIDDAHTFGGAQIALMNIINCLILSEKYEIILFASKNNLKKLIERDKLQKIKVICIPTARPLNIAQFIFGLSGTYRVMHSYFTDKSYIWVVNLSGIEFCLSSLVMMKINDVKTIGWLHNSQSFTRLLPDKPLVYKIINKIRDIIADNLIFGMYDMLIVPSQSEKKLLSLRTKNAKNIEVIRNPVKNLSMQSLFILSKLKKNKQNYLKEYVNIFVVGRIEFSTKGQDKCVGISSAMADRGIAVNFIFVGDGPDSKLLGDKFKEAGLSYEITGWMENPYENISNYNIILICSNFESGSLVAIEAMSLGIPIVSANLPVFHEVLPSECVTEGESSELYADKIISILKTDLNNLIEKYQDKLIEYTTENIQRKIFSILKTGNYC